VRSSHLFRIFQEEEEEEREDVTSVTSRLLVQTTVSGEAEDHFRFKIHGGDLNCDIYLEEISPLCSLKPFRLRLNASGRLIDLKNNTTASSYENITTLAINGSVTWDRYPLGGPGGRGTQNETGARRNARPSEDHPAE